MRLDHFLHQLELGSTNSHDQDGTGLVCEDSLETLLKACVLGINRWNDDRAVPALQRRIGWDGSRLVEEVERDGMHHQSQVAEHEEECKECIHS